MSDKASNIPQVMFSVRAYQLLLNAYPAKFQQEYGPHMAQVFQDCCLRAVRQGRINGMARLWVVTLLDFIRSVFEQHLQQEIDMSKSNFIKLSGWAFVLGAVLFLIFFVGHFLESIHSGYYWRLNRFFNQTAYTLSFFVSLIPFAIGMLGLRARYGETIGSLGRKILLTGAIAPVISYIGSLLVETDDGYWAVSMAGILLLFTCLTFFGVLATRRKPLLRWNSLPIIAGILFPVFFLISTNDVVLARQYAEFVFPIMVIQSIALIILGYVLQADIIEETFPAD